MLIKNVTFLIDRECDRITITLDNKDAFTSIKTQNGVGVRWCKDHSIKMQNGVGVQWCKDHSIIKCI
jgi:hypothetical protein